MAEPTKTGKRRVLVVGGGFAGFQSARRLSRTLARNGVTDAEVAIVAPNDYLLYTPLLPDVAGGLLDPRSVAVPLTEALPGVRYLPGLVESVDLDRRTVQTNDGADVSWDRLVLTPGSVTKLFDVPGLAENARGLKTIAEAIYLRDHLLEELEAATHDPDEKRQQARRTVVVVGASYAGTELIAQLRALADDAAAHGGYAPSVVRFVLLDVAKQVMPEVGAKLGERALEVLRKRGIDVRMETTLKEVTDEQVVLSDDTVVPTHTVAWVAGVTGNPLLATLDLEMDHGRLVVQDDLSVPGHPHVFAAGDAAAVPDLTDPGQITPPTAQHATRQGVTLANNVAASLGIGASRRYRHRNMGLVVDLGPHFAVANPLNVHLSGRPAKAVTRAYHLYALPRGANRLSVATSYVTDLFTRRSLVSLGLVPHERASFAGEHREPPH